VPFEITYDMYRYVFIGGLIACGVFFAIAVVLFFTLRIPKVISDLSGRTARKAIENIRLQNEQSGDKTIHSHGGNKDRSMLTDRISHSGRIVPRNKNPFNTGVITEKISTQELPPEPQTDVLVQENETTLHSQAGQTDVLDAAGQTDVLFAPAGQTDVLFAPAGQTDVLSPVAGAAAMVQPQQTFSVEYEITFIHTNEVIPQGV